MFDLFSEEDKTKLRVIQTDIESFPNHPHFKKERFEGGWDNLLGQNLKHLLENSNNSTSRCIGTFAGLILFD
ncbi:hypothetical protein DXT99_08105 [Pontibacter diazotrophicus]|uniref:Uncharacterized protein n=1 Tax=Pontibacter diazotrophicus TaxID=1400979 RepID=A0A3D8LEQ3_9BACT|nr:hypothetical protein DXT99_08105 [Pontibacter diazotrophicus]